MSNDFELVLNFTLYFSGPLLLQDHVYIEEIAHFDRERIPERVVHAKGAGAFGYFEVTHDITKYCKVSTIYVYVGYILKGIFKKYVYLIGCCIFPSWETNPNCLSLEYSRRRIWIS